MSSRTWLNTDDVLQDLQKFSGRRPVENFIDDDCFVRGENPPPPLRCEEDDELVLRYGRISDLNNGNDVDAPDLRGIEQMLNMVRSYETTDVEDDVLPTDEFTISKLNPDVKEFVPVSNKNEVDTPQNGAGDHSKIDVQKLDAKEKLKITADLKHAIAKTKGKNMAEKRERNMAIATLLKLHTTPQPEAEVETSVKLCTPDFFAKPIDEGGEEAPIEEVITKTDCNVATDTAKSPIPNEPDDSVKDSIKKVNNWLDNPEKPKRKGPGLYLGPIVFKRKGASTPKSPCSDLSDNSKASSSTNGKSPLKVSPKGKDDGNRAFVPSKYADALVKQYTERSKVMEDQQLDIWEKVEKALKIRDEMHRKIQEEKAAEANADDEVEVVNESDTETIQG